MRFADRVDAGRKLAERMGRFRGEDTVVLGLPRGGVPVAFEVARALDAPLDVIVARKLGLPYQPELAMGAIGEDDVRVVDTALVYRSQLTAEELSAAERAERAELERQAGSFRAERPRLPLAGRTAIVVDDGVATGATARVACQVAKAAGAARVVVAVPVGSPDTVAELGEIADEVVCLQVPDRFYAVGQWYEDFSPVSDDDVLALLRRVAEPVPTPAGDPPVRDEEIEVRARSVPLAGHLTIPERPVGMVLFVHGSGSSRHSPRNRYVAEVLNDAGLGTLLFDLLTPREATDRNLVFDIELLAQRLVEVTGWLRAQPECAQLRIGYFGASTGAAAALRAATDPRVSVSAIVSRGGRPDLAGPGLSEVRAPTLLIVGGRDDIVLALNRKAQAELRCENSLVVVPGATHLFEEPGTLEQAARLARDWFTSHLTPTPEPARPGGRGR
jgi:putative phosphoribosyl transferase